MNSTKLRPCCHFARVALLLALILLAAPSAYSQGTAAIVGTVTDNSGAVVPAAKVTVKNLGTNLTRTSATGASGEYSFTLLPIGDYSVSVEANGFQAFAYPRLSIATGDRARLDASLQVAGSTQSVEVVGEAAPQLQTDSSELGGLITTQAVRDLPTNGRNFMDLATLAPGANSGPAISQQSGQRIDDRRQSAAISANGQGLATNNYLLDGMDNNERNIATIIVRPSVDALEEVKVITSNYPAEYGRAGGAVVNLITKSGTNSVHGTLYEFLRNDIFDARSFFSPVKGKYRQNQFGGSVGAPIVKDKTFVFADYEALRIVQGIVSQPAGSGIVPTPCEMGLAACNGITQLGNFSDLLPGVVLYDPVSSPSGSAKVPFKNNLIPLNRINQTAANYASSIIPGVQGAQCAGTVCRFLQPLVRTQFSHTADLRIDQRIGDADNFFARYSINDVFTQSPGALPPATFKSTQVFPGGTNGNPGTTTFPGPADQKNQALTISDVHIFRPNLVAQVSLQGSRFDELSVSDNWGKNVSDLMGPIPNGNVPGLLTGWLPFAFSGQYSQIGDSFAIPTGQYDTNYQLTANVTWTKGVHAFKFGTSILRRTWSLNQALFAGSFTFATAQTNSTAGLAGGSGGNAFASMLLGYPSALNRNFGLVSPTYQTTEYGNYFQDDWRVTRKLTLNLGVRWDIFRPFKERNNSISNFDPSNPAILQSAQIRAAGVNGVSQTVDFKTQYGDFQPRLGFAYSIAQGTVIRGGFAMSYFPQTYSGPSQLRNQPFQYAYTPGTAAGFPSITIQNAFPAVAPQSTCLAASCGLVLPPGQTSLTVSTGMATEGGSYGPLKVGRINMYNLQVQQAFGPNLVALGFVGVTGRNLGRQVQVDQALPPNGPGVSPSCVGVIQTRNPNPCQQYAANLPLVAAVNLMTSRGYSNYNAFQAQYLRRMSAGLTVNANYTWAHGLDTVGANGANACGTCGQVVNNLDYDYGTSDIDVRSRFAITGSYEVPFAKSKKGAAWQVVKGWQINGIYTWTSGLPFNVTDSENLMGNAATAYRVNITQGASDFQQSLGQWFDASQFRQQPLGTAGNAPRNLLTAPHISKLDMSIFKTFPIRESIKLQFRAEVFNLTNTPSFAPPVSAMSAWVQPGTTTACPPTGNPACVPSFANQFGQITATLANYTPRDFQFALKLTF
jgi:hypothetical protein